MNKVIKILMERDGMTAEDAEHTLNIVLEEASELVANSLSMWEAACDVEDYICGELNIDPDYLIDIVDFL